MASPYLQCPKHWCHSSLEPNAENDLIVSVDSGGTPNTGNEDYWDGEIFWLTPKEITNLGDSIYVSKTERTITKQGLKNSAAKVCPPGTVMLTKRAPVGAVAINTVPMATNQGFLNFQCGTKLRPLYLAYWFRVNKIYLDMVANGSTYPELYKSDLFEFEIAVPTLSEQDSVLNAISAVQYTLLLGNALEQSAKSPEEMIKLQRQDERLRSIRDAILPSLLSGKIDSSKIHTNFLEYDYPKTNTKYIQLTL